MRLRDIPLYISDTDVVMCYTDGCDFEAWLPGRRVGMGELLQAFADHIHVEHGEVIEDLHLVL